MISTFTLHKDYTLFRKNYQLVLPLEIEYLVPPDDSVRLLDRFVDGMFLGDLYWTYCRKEKEGELTGL